MSQALITDTDRRALCDLSTKGFDIRRERQARALSGPVEICSRGVIASESGKLAVCDPADIKGFDERLAELPRSWPAPPEMMQGNGFVIFRNLWGDGMFDIYSRGGSFFIQTQREILLDPLLRSAVGFEREGWCRPTNRFEGVVGVGTGAMAVFDPGKIAIDPSLVSIRNLRRGTYHTILETGPGQFECGFIYNCTRFRLRPAPAGR